jgi:hypothetical protein
MSTQKARAKTMLLTAALALACGGPPKKGAEQPSAPAPSAAADPGSGTTEGQAMSEEELAALAEVEAQADAPVSPAAPADGAGREVVYRMTPDGLKVEVEGAVFAPLAQSYKTKDGYGVEITVEASSKVAGLLANPEAGPLAFAGRVIRKSGRVDQFGDKRSGQGTKSLGPASPQKFSRKWPIAGVSLLSPGDELELEIGLWGYGTSEATMRPVRKFASLRMKASSDGASPVIDAPGQ